MKKMIAKFIHNQSGATAVEYAILVAGVAFLVAGGAALISGDITAFFTSVGDEINPTP